MSDLVICSRYKVCTGCVMGHDRPHERRNDCRLFCYHESVCELASVEETVLYRLEGGLIR